MLGKCDKAREYHEKALAITIEVGNRQGEATIYGNLGTLFQALGKYSNAREYQKKALAIRLEIGNRNGEAKSYGNLGILFQSLGKYDKAREYQEKALAITIEIGDRNGEASSYGNLGILFQSLGQYDKAQVYQEKALAIRIEIGDRHGEATSYGNLGTLFEALGKYGKAREYQEKALAITIEIGDRNGEATSYGNLGTLSQSLGQCDKARIYQEKALAIGIEVGDRDREAIVCGNLGTLFRALGKYDKAREYQEKALAIRLDIGHRNGVATSYGNLGTLFQDLGKYDQAREYQEKALATRIEIGDRNGEAASYGNLGKLFELVGRYEKAREYYERALAITTEIGEWKGQAKNHNNFGTLFSTLGEYDKAQEHYEKALRMWKRVGNRKEEATIYGNLGNLFIVLGKYRKADEYLEKALAIRLEICDRRGVAANYEHLGLISLQCGCHDKAQEYHNNALAIQMEISDKEGTLASLMNLGLCFQSLGKYEITKEYFKKALLLSRDIGNNLKEFQCLCCLTMLSCEEHEEREEAISYLFQSIAKYDTLRAFLDDNDQFKTSFLEEHGTFPYKLLSVMLCSAGKPKDSLYVEELRRARGLADLMAARYSIEEQISGNPQSWCGIQEIITREVHCACLYVSVEKEDARFWILKATGAIHFTEKEVGLEANSVTGLVPDLDEFLKDSFRSLGILPQENCEDRSLDDTESMSLRHESRPAPRDYNAKDIKANLQLCYEIIIAPVANLLKEPEIIIVPDSCMYQVPFAALSDEGNKYLSETFRLRIVPSLTTLKCIQDSPPDYHSQTGALIVGDPEVGEVIHNGRRKTMTALPCARKEAEMIGRLLGVTPLIGDRAKKQAVLQKINSVSLIHLAAHGCAERGEIALSPMRPSLSIPREKDYLLTMVDISKIQLRAKLVVLSCCHSGKGEIKAEGMIGIARAFLGSGARSVLAARWALNDEATEQFMTCFYKHLFRGESASESLHEARRWMRNNGFDKVSDWAPFMLIGDNVTFDFRSWSVPIAP